MAKGIFKRPNSQYYWIRYVGIDGKIKRESSGSNKFRYAEALLIKRKQAIKEGKEPEIKRIKNYTFDELVAEYNKWAERQRSFTSKKYLIKDLSETFGSLPLRRFNTMLTEQYQSGKLQKEYKPATVNRLIATLSRVKL
jgi:hypothetical protein